MFLVFLSNYISEFYNAKNFIIRLKDFIRNIDNYYIRKFVYKFVFTLVLCFHLRSENVS